MSLTGRISLGDLLRAAGELKPDEDTTADIARLLKLTPPESPEKPEARESEPGPDASRAPAPGVTGGDMAEEVREALNRIAEKRKQARFAREEQARLEREKQEKQLDDTPAGVVVVEELTEAKPPLPSRLVKVEGGNAEEPSWAGEVEVLPKADARPAAEPQGFEPLLMPTWTRALLSTVLARRANDGPIDLERLVELVARGEVTMQLPRLPRPTLAGGVQLLIDRGETMLPFLEDQERLEEQVKKVAGLGFDKTLYFEGCPTRRAGPGGRSEWERYPTPRSPNGGTVLLLLTDLGIGRPLWPGASAGEGEWAAFARAMRKRGCPVVALVPYAPERWPAGLQKLMTIIQWDRPTSASLVHARVGKGHDT
jgi:hypothetical protein